MIDSFVSPVIYVDSRRKLDRIKDEVFSENMQKSCTDYYNLFEPCSFDKPYFKKKNGDSYEVNPNLGGFINYFTAPNIRNKIRNPLFLIYKFKDCFKAYYNVTVGNY